MDFLFAHLSREQSDRVGLLLFIFTVAIIIVVVAIITLVVVIIKRWKNWKSTQSSDSDAKSVNETQYSSGEKTINHQETENEW